MRFIRRHSADAEDDLALRCGACVARHSDVAVRRCARLIALEHRRPAAAELASKSACASEGRLGLAQTLRGSCTAAQRRRCRIDCPSIPAQTAVTSPLASLSSPAGERMRRGTACMSLCFILQLPAASDQPTAADVRRSSVELGRSSINPARATNNQEAHTWWSGVLTRWRMPRCS
jgi:hypothetical protein